MKKITILLSFLIIAFSAMSQNAIPNGNLESWSSSTYEYPENYFFNSNIDMFLHGGGQPFNVEKTTDAYHGSYAVKLTSQAISNSDTAFGYVLNVDPKDGDPSTWVGGIPISGTPTGIRGYYKYNVATADSATVIVSFNKNGASIGAYILKIGGIETNYTLFDLNFTPALSDVPDSVVIGFASSDVMSGDNGVDGSILFIDSVSFKGITVQPPLMNGDFENWQIQSAERPDNWYVESDLYSANKSSDAYKGDYSIELITRAGTDNSGNPKARSTEISTGYWDENCNCMQGGYPFSNNLDTLEFWYKYDAAGNDSAIVFLEFRFMGTPVWGIQKVLYPSASYQHAELPFVIMMTSVDTVTVNVTSSYWNNENPIHIGSTLLIDEIQFKSEPVYTGIQNVTNDNNVIIYPNPASEHFVISGLNSDNNRIEIYNITGSLVYVTYSKNQNSKSIDISNFIKGVYFVKIMDGNKFYTEKLVVK